ncbi:DUF1294 domain-containing protein [Acuticoccus mangrovi]|uniref:DUF1294 domain-containing protein n=1 Tax=Acuticoccus mangrovi TaxID=2796142 RepID=A0A934ID52_9HYPH|nr:DUF1294 domain-containing protein [Acuticoccus mangrovi]MBJ3774363.1 DUF1294 domain-containing protein [Acuticoccus mangrovi]
MFEAIPPAIGWRGVVVGLLVALATFVLLINVASVAVFVADKRAAIAGRRRVPERALLTLAALGGAPAMVAVSRTVHHKTRKEPFRSLLRAILALQILALLGASAWGLGLV